MKPRDSDMAYEGVLLCFLLCYVVRSAKCYPDDLNRLTLTTVWAKVS